MPTDESGTTPPYLYSPSIIEPAAFSMADAFVQRVQRFKPEDRVHLVRLVRERIKANDPAIAAGLAEEVRGAISSTSSF